MNELPQCVSDLASLKAEGVRVAESRIGSEAWNKVNEIDKVFAGWPEEGVEVNGQLFVPATNQTFPVRHLFTPGLYCREITMPAGAMLTSAIHLLEHPFIISAGRCEVWDDDGWKELRAPHHGVTLPGTRRVLRILETTIWTTMHVTNETDPEKILAAITYDHLKLGHLAEIPRMKTKENIT